MSWLTKIAQIPAEQLSHMLWYHGTDSVTAYGLLNDMTLRPREETGGTSYEGSLSSIQSAVYLTSSPGKAAKHAIDRVEQYKGTHPVIFVIQPESLGYVHIDEDLVHMLINGSAYFENEWYPSPTLVQEIFEMAANELQLDDWESGKSDQQLVLEHFEYQKMHGGNEEIEDEYFQEEGIVPDSKGNYEYDESMHLAKSIAVALNDKHQKEAIQNFQSMAHEGKVVASEIYLIPQILNRKMDDGTTWQDSPTSLKSYEELQEYGTQVDSKQLLMPFMTQSSTGKANWLQKISQNDLVNHAKAVVQQSFDMVPSYFPPDLKGEIEFRFAEWIQSVELDEHYDEDVISETPFSLLYSTVYDIGDEEVVRRSWIIAIRTWQIELGVYVTITPEEMQNVMVTHGKKYDFKMNGVFYVFDKHPPHSNRTGVR